MRAGRRRWLVATFLAIVLVLGGGGSPNPLAELAVQLTAASLAIAWFLSPGHSQTPKPELRWIAAIVLLIPALHLVPLPPALWQSLPGRELQSEALALVGAQNDWRPLSIAPYQTLTSLLTMIVPAGLMLATARLSGADVRRCLWTIVIATAAAAGLAFAQVLAEPGALRLYEETHRDWATGFFANRNAAADGFIIAMLAGATLLTGRVTPAARTFLLAATGAFLVAIVLTGSRAGFALALPVLIIAALQTRSFGSRGSARRIRWPAIALASVVLPVTLVLAGWRGTLLGERFLVGGDARWSLWQDGWAAITAYWPVGSGLGTFQRAFLPFERLEHVDFSMPNRMHNDYLELMLEAGLPGLIALAVIGILIWRLIRSSFRSPCAPSPIAWFAIGTILLIALHSAVDYPLRTMALSCLMAFAVGLLGNRNITPVRSGGDGGVR